MLEGPSKLSWDCHVCAVACCLEESCCSTLTSPSGVQLLHNDLRQTRGDLTALGADWELLPLAKIDASVGQVMLLLQKLLLECRS